MKPWSLVAALLAAAAAAVPALGQDRALAAGDKVRLTQAAEGAGRFTAVVVDVRPDALLVRTRPDAPVRTIPLSGLQRMEVARGRRGRVKEGALIGFVPGFVLGFVAARAIACDEQGVECSGVGAGLAGGAMLGGLTAAAGGLVGLAVRTDRWQAVPVPAGRSTRLGAALMPVRGGVGARLTVAF